MMIPTPVIVVCAAIGFLTALLLWWCGIVPWWAIPLVAAFAPVAVFLAILGAFYMLWIVSGSH